MSNCIGTFKILIVGDSGIGKSSLMMRFVDNMFDPEISATIGLFGDRRVRVALLAVTFVIY